jgi:hypothetical protein
MILYTKAAKENPWVDFYHISLKLLYLPPTAYFPVFPFICLAILFTGVLCSIINPIETSMGNGGS